MQLPNVIYSFVYRCLDEYQSSFIYNSNSSPYKWWFPTNGICFRDIIYLILPICLTMWSHTSWVKLFLFFSKLYIFKMILYHKLFFLGKRVCGFIWVWVIWKNYQELEIKLLLCFLVQSEMNDIRIIGMGVI